MQAVNSLAKSPRGLLLLWNVQLPIMAYLMDIYWGQEGSAALFGGVRYGEGQLYTKNAGNHSLFWQGPTLGFDIGADGSKVMMLVYNLPSTDAIYGRYPGVEGSAYVVGGSV